MKRYVALVATSAALLCGCVPFPHVRQTKPEIDGALTVNGSPASGVRVRTCVKGLGLQKCEIFKETQTDEHGRFHLPGASEFQGFALLYGDPLNSYGIDVFSGGQYISWGSGGIGYSPEHVTLRCTLSDRLVCETNP